MKFYICRHCGNIIAMVKESGVRVVCCGDTMEELIPGTEDGAGEKHIPLYEVKGDTVYVRVGSVTHPMMPAHFIQWIALETEQGSQRKDLRPGDKPEARFKICEGDKVTGVYEYCSVHDLWKADQPTVGCCTEEERPTETAGKEETEANGACGKDACELKSAEASHPSAAKPSGNDTAEQSQPAGAAPAERDKVPGEKGYGHGYGDEGYDLWKKSDMK